MRGITVREELLGRQGSEGAYRAGRPEGLGLGVPLWNGR